MAATTAGALKAFLEGQGLGVSVYRDKAPAGTSRPFITVSEDVSTVPDLSGDFGDVDAPVTVRELAQVDVWQAERSGTAGESYTLVPAVLRALHGADLTAAPKKVYGVRVFDSRRLVEPDNGVVHQAVTVEIRRAL